MFEEKIDVKHKINVESMHPHVIKRPSTFVPEQYEDTPEFRQSMNLKVIIYCICVVCYFKNTAYSTFTITA